MEYVSRATVFRSLCDLRTVCSCVLRISVLRSFCDPRVVWSCVSWTSILSSPASGRWFPGCSQFLLFTFVRSMVSGFPPGFIFVHFIRDVPHYYIVGSCAFVGCIHLCFALLFCIFLLKVVLLVYISPPSKCAFFCQVDVSIISSTVEKSLSKTQWN